VIAEMIRTSARPIRLGDGEDLINRKGRRVFRKDRKGKPLCPSAKTSAPFAFRTPAE
jgi:hypothetical protein